MAKSNPQSQPAALETTTLDSTPEFAALLKSNFKPKSDRAQEAIESAVKTLAESSTR